MQDNQLNKYTCEYTIDLAQKTYLRALANNNKKELRVWKRLYDQKSRESVQNYDLTTKSEMRESQVEDSEQTVDPWDELVT